MEHVTSLSEVQKPYGRGLFVALLVGMPLKMSQFSLKADWCKFKTLDKSPNI
jgi:hypothetical protein